MSLQPAALPLSMGRRRLYLRTLILIFFIAAPFLLLYATGYRFGGFTELVKTGGVYVSADRADAQISINGELVRETGTFRRAFFVQDLKPGTYTLEVTKEGYHPWGKTLSVYAHIVTEAQAFNIRREPVLTHVPEMRAEQTSNATTTSLVPNLEYEEVIEYFATSTRMLDSDTIIRDTSSELLPARDVSSVATTTKEFGGMRLYELDNRVVAQWMRKVESAPFYFCTFRHICVLTITLNTKNEQPKNFDFYPKSENLVLVALSDGVYVTEIDNRSGQNIQPLVEGADVDFRVIDDRIYVRINGEIYKVEL